MTSSNSKRPRGPRKAIITAATLQRAQELLTEHRAASNDLAHLMASTAGQSRIQVSVEPGGGTYSVLRDSFARLLAQDIAAIEGEAKRLGVQLAEPPPAPLLDPAPQAEAT